MPGFQAGLLTGAGKPINYETFMRKNLLPSGLILLMLVCLAACKKNNDGSAYTTNLIISDFVLNADSITVLYDEGKVTGNRSLYYGATSTQNNSPYLRLGAGTHTLKILAGATVVRQNVFTLSPGQYYSLFLYDSIKNDAVKTALQQDAVIPVDTMAQVRFINMIPGSDTLTLTLNKDTTINRTDGYIGNKTTPSYAFSTFRPGLWKVSLSRSSAIVPADTFRLQAGKLYSFYAQGLNAGSGMYKESIFMIRHN